MTAKEIYHRELSFTCRDGLRLFCRDFGPLDSPAAPVLCLPGLTRNSKDFVEVAERYGTNRRFLCPDLRGRGRSDRDPDYTRYQPLTYTQDMWELLASAGVARVVVIGTSLGGLMAMIMAHARPEAVAGVVLNDVGPEVVPEGLARVSGYVGWLPEVEDWAGALAQSKEVYEIALPNLSDEEWLRFTERQYREDENGVPRLEYDPKIGEALRDVGGIPVDPWELFKAMRSLPVVALRGAISDILSAETFDAMAAVKPDLVRVTIPDRGHVPLLDEPECIAALDDFLQSV